jgi:hypothetical protein
MVSVLQVHILPLPHNAAFFIERNAHQLLKIVFSALVTFGFRRRLKKIFRQQHFLQRLAPRAKNCAYNLPSNAHCAIFCPWPVGCQYVFGHASFLLGADLFLCFKKL